MVVAEETWQRAGLVHVKCGAGHPPRFFFRVGPPVRVALLSPQPLSLARSDSSHQTHRVSPTNKKGESISPLSVSALSMPKRLPGPLRHGNTPLWLSRGQLHIDNRHSRTIIFSSQAHPPGWPLLGTRDSSCCSMRGVSHVVSTSDLSRYLATRETVDKLVHEAFRTIRCTESAE